MHKQLSTWQLIHQSLQNNIAVMLLYVLESKGSSPGRQGFMMAVNEAGEINGSLGGGIMEHKFVEMAKAKLHQHTAEASVYHQIHDKAAAKNQSGMICSGEQTIFLYTIKKEEATIVEHIIASLQQHQNGTLSLSPAGLSFSNDIPVKNYQLDIRSNTDFIFKEKTGYKNKLHIIGAGHCALSLSELMSNMDFYIYLYDDRQDLNTMEQNSFVHEKHVLNDYEELKQLIVPTPNSYMVIMTFGYRTDAMAIKAVQGKECNYIGVLGSKSKMKKLITQLQEEGAGKEWLEKIHTPIGIQIKSQTPEEIAVSIAAEIIKIKNQDL